MTEEICNVCNKPFIKGHDGNWINHEHKLNPNAQALGSIKIQEESRNIRRPRPRYINQPHKLDI